MMNNVSIRATMGLNPGNLQIISFNAWISSDLAGYVETLNNP